MINAEQQGMSRGLTDRCARAQGALRATHGWTLGNLPPESLKLFGYSVLSGAGDQKRAAMALDGVERTLESEAVQKAIDSQDEG